MWKKPNVHKEVDTVKKSIIEAQKRALQISEEHPDLTVRVLDKSRKHAVVNTSDWVYRERVLEGWHTVATFKGGKEVGRE